MAQDQLGAHPVFLRGLDPGRDPALGSTGRFRPKGRSPKFSPDFQEVCEVQSQWVRPQSQFPLVILVQEVHVNPLAQKNIARTLEHFEKKFKDLGLDEEIVIALEGSPKRERCSKP